MDKVRIDPKLIPDYVYDEGCRVLYASITRLLADPKRRQEFEEWEAEYIAENRQTIVKNTPDGQ